PALPASLQGAHQESRGRGGRPALHYRHRAWRADQHTGAGYRRADLPPWSRGAPEPGPSRQQGLRRPRPHYPAGGGVRRSGGRQTRVFPGNRDFAAGGRIPRPEGGGGGAGGGSEAGNTGEGEDDFVFQITQEEFLDFMFEDLALPNLIKRHLTGTDNFRTVRAGFSQQGNPSRINVVRSMRAAHARRIALSGASRARLREAQRELEMLRREQPDNLIDIQALEKEIEQLRARIDRVP